METRRLQNGGVLKRRRGLHPHTKVSIGSRQESRETTHNNIQGLIGHFQMHHQQ